MDPELIKHVDRAIGFTLITALGIGITWLWRATWRRIYRSHPKLNDWGFRTHSIQENVHRLYDEHLAAKAEDQALRDECDRLNGRPPRIPTA